MDPERVKINNKGSYTPKSRIFIQYVAAYSVTISMFLTGICWGWIGPVYLMFFGESPPFNVTEAQLSWTASIASLSSIPGAVISASIVDKIGRKNILLFSAVPFFTTWILTYFATNIKILNVARAINGLAMGSVSNVVPMYIGEISSPQIRGRLSNFIGLQIKLGVLCAYCVGSYASFRTSSLIYATAPIIFFVTFIWMPDSHYFYLMKNDERNAIKSLNFFRGKKYDVKEEIRTKAMSPSSNLWQLFLVPSNRKSLYISLTLFSTQQFCGISALSAFAPIIFEQLNYSLDPKICNVIFGLSSIVAIFLSGFIVDRVGRRILVIISAVTVATGLFIIGLYFYLKNVIMVLNIEQYSLIPTVSLMLFPFNYGIGLNSLPYVCISELFSTEFKAIASCINIIYCSAMSFLILKLYHTIEVNYGLYTNMFAFSTCTLIGVIFIYLFLPETKQQTLEDIQIQLKK